MKKTILAAVIALATAPAFAAVNVSDTVAETVAQNVDVKVSGAAEVQVINKYADESTIRLDDGDLQFDATSALTDNLDAIATMAFKYEDATATNDVLTVGIKNDVATFTIGRQVTITDDSGIDEDYELGQNIGFGTTDGEQVAKFKYDNNTFQFGISYLNKEDKIESEAVKKEADSKEAKTEENDILDLMVGAKAGNFEGQIYYTDSETDSYNGAKYQVKYTIEQVTLAASYSDMEKANADIDGYSLVGTFTADANKFALGYNFIDSDVATDDFAKGETSRVYANVTHTFNDYVATYAEVGFQDVEANDNAEDFGYVMGMEVKF